MSDFKPNVSEAAIEQLRKEGDFFQKILDNRQAIVALTSSPAWALWLELTQVSVEGYKDAAFRAKTVEERENARTMGQALEKFSRIPLILAMTAQKASPDAGSPDSLVTPDQENKGGS